MKHKYTNGFYTDTPDENAGYYLIELHARNLVPTGYVIPCKDYGTAEDLRSREFFGALHKDKDYLILGWYDFYHATKQSFVYSVAT